MTQTQHYDVVIIGGGLVGISLALALARLPQPPRIALVEAHDYQHLPPPGFDARTVALSYSSRQIFTGLGLWSAIEAAGVAPIRTIHISDRGHPGTTRLSAAEQGVDALGYVVENRILGQTLLAALQQQTTVTMLTSAKVTAVTLHGEAAEVVLAMPSTSLTIQTSLVVAADGTQSFVRDFFSVKTWRMDYQQQAVIANLAMDKPHQEIAYERFTATGPMALLPLPGFADTPNRYGLVWTVPQSQVAEVLAMDDTTFLQAIRSRFGERVDGFGRVGARSAYPLGMMQIREHVRSRLAIIGNAAHTLHPVAGQGFNLGLRDVAALAQVIRDARARTADIGALTELEHYAQWRKRDQWQTMLFTDGMVRAFSTDFSPVVLARNVALLAMEVFSPLRKRVAHQAMGYIGRSSLLARGLEL